jgi:hypothetical protein
MPLSLSQATFWMAPTIKFLLLVGITYK